MRWFLIFLFCLAAPVTAQENARINEILSAWQEWTKGARVSKSTIAIGYKGKVVAERGLGVNPQVRMPVASLSKAITATCVGRLMSSKKLPLSTSLGQIFGPGLSNLGLSNPATAKVTVAQLITHTSGIPNDSTRKDLLRYGGGKGKHAEVAKRALKKKARGSSYRYSNENYAILGLVIETLSGASYANYCKQSVLSPHGAGSARLSQRYGGKSSWGGWEISARDYQKFLWGNFGPNRSIGKSPDRWARADRGKGRAYGMGANFRRFGSGYNFWHFGGHCGGGQVPAGAYFALWQGVWSVTVTFDACASNGQDGRLDRLLSNAALR